MHNWEKTAISAVSTEYICLKCAEFYVAYNNPDEIVLPPLDGCVDIPPKDKHNE